MKTAQPCTTKGGALFEFVRGVTYKKGEARSEPFPDSVAILRAGNISDDGLSFDDLVYVPAARVNSKQRLRRGDIVIAMSSGSASVVGKAAAVDCDLPDVSFGAFCGVCRPVRPEYSDWLRHFFASPEYRRVVRGAALGVNINNLRPSVLLELKLPFPTLDEQRRIVAKLDALRARSRKAKEALDGVPALLARLRQSILAAAFRGELTADWREENPDVEPASELLERIRIERRKRWEEAQLAKMIARGKPPKNDRWKAKYVEAEPVDESDLPELPEGWCWTTIEAIAWDGPTNGRSPRSSPNSTGPLTLRLSATSQGRCVLNAATTKRTDLSSPPPEDLWIQPGDILIQRANTLDLVGTVAVFDGPPNTYIYPDLMMRLRMTLPMLAEWSWRTLSSPYTRNYFRSNATGTAGNMPKINGSVVRRTPIPLPPEPELRVALERCASALTFVDALRSACSSSTAKLATLDAGILAAAFRGELTERPEEAPSSLLSASP